MRFEPGDDIIFTSTKGRRQFKGYVVKPQIVKGKILVRLTTDPFPVEVSVAQVVKVDEDGLPIQLQSRRVKVVRTKKEKVMPPKSKAKQLREEAKALGVEGWSGMGLTELAAAVKRAKAGKAGTSTKTRTKPAAAKRAPARKVASKPAVATKRKPAVKKAAATKKTATASKKATKRVLPPRLAPSGPNPFRPGSNVHKMAEELLRGGRRVDMIKRLKKAMQIHPWSKEKEENPEKAIDKRLLITAGVLKSDHGFRVVMDGRGSTGTIQVFPPGRGAKKSAGQTAKSRASSSKTTTKKAPAKKR